MKTSNKLLLGLIAFLLLGIVSFAISARVNVAIGHLTGNGKKLSKTIPVSNFDKAKIQGKVRVYLTQGPIAELKINADENLMEQVETTVENGELEIRLKQKIGIGDSVIVFLTVNHLSQLSLSKGTMVVSTNPIVGDEIKVESVSGSKGNLQLVYQKLACEVSSGAKVLLEGEAQKAVFNFSSGASLNALELVVTDCEAEGSSGAKAKLNVTNELDVDVSSGAHLEYSGTAKLGLAKINSGGKIERK